MGLSSVGQDLGQGWAWGSARLDSDPWIRSHVTSLGVRLQAPDRDRGAQNCMEGEGQDDRGFLSPDTHFPLSHTPSLPTSSPQITLSLPESKISHLEARSQAWLRSSTTPSRFFHFQKEMSVD